MYKVTVRYRNMLFSGEKKYHDSVDTCAGIVSAVSEKAARSKTIDYYTKFNHDDRASGEQRKLIILAVETERITEPTKTNLMVSFFIP